jgi:hypothetical protein
VCVGYEGGKQPVCTLLEKASEVEVPGCPGWIHPNPGEAGYYLYSLPAEQLEALAGKARLSPREQAGLVDDIDALLRSGQMPLADGLDAIAALARSRDRLTAGRSMEILALVSRSVVEPPGRRRFAALVATWGPLARELGITHAASDGGLTGGLRAALVPFVARDGGEVSLQKQALRRLDDWLTAGRSAPQGAELEILTRIAAPAGGAALFDRLVADRSGRITAGLAHFRQAPLVARMLAAVSGDDIGPPEAIDLLARLIADAVAQEQAIPVALGKWEELAGRLADTDRPRAARVFAGVCRAAERDKVAALFEKVLTREGVLLPHARAVLDEIDDCVAFRRHHQAAAAAYFK